MLLLLVKQTSIALTLQTLPCGVKVQVSEDYGKQMGTSSLQQDKKSTPYICQELRGLRYEGNSGIRFKSFITIPGEPILIWKPPLCILGPPRKLHKVPAYLEGGSWWYPHCFITMVFVNLSPPKAMILDLGWFCASPSQGHFGNLDIFLVIKNGGQREGYWQLAGRGQGCC